MAWSKIRKRDFASDLNVLIGDLCGEWGFCNQLTAGDLVADGRTLTASEFGDAVLKAEGMDPELEIQWFRRIKRSFIDRYGCEAISSEDYVVSG